MKRKVIQIANSTQLVSLPRRWALKFNVKKGSELDIKEMGNQLVVSTKHHSDIEQRELDLANLEPMAVRYISAMYKSGVDEIKIYYQAEEQIHRLSQSINELMPGFEVLSQSEKNILIKDLAYESNPDFDSVLRRIFLLTISMAENVKDCMEKIEKGVCTEELDAALAFEKTNNRLCNYCMRFLNKYDYPEFKKTNFMYAMIYEIEKIADELKFLCIFFKELLKKKEKLVLKNKDTKMIFKRMIDYFKEFYEAYYKCDSSKISYLGEERKKLIKDATELFSKLNKQEFMILHYTINIIQSIFNMTPTLMVKCMGDNDKF